MFKWLDGYICDFILTIHQNERKCSVFQALYYAICHIIMSIIWIFAGIAHTFFVGVNDKARSGELINVLKEAGQTVPENLLAFGTTTKKKESKLYGAHFKEIDPSAKATKIVFDDWLHFGLDFEATQVLKQFWYRWLSHCSYCSLRFIIKTGILSTTQEFLHRPC